MPTSGKAGSAAVLHAKIYRGLLRHAILRLALLYFIPLLLLTFFFNLQYRLVLRDSEERHRESLATHQAAMLELFLGDRLIKLTDLIDEPGELLAPRHETLRIRLDELKADSGAFVDLSVLDGAGRVLGYAGPLPFLEGQNYSRETWFTRLIAGDSPHVITDVHPGFRDEPHFTMAIRLEIQGQVRILRAVLAPDIPRAMLAEQEAELSEPGGGLMRSLATNLWLFSILFCLLGALVIGFQARWVARQQFTSRMKERELSRQLGHAAKLALVGEMAAGIAHEINNPLAVVAEKAGLMKDLLDPRLPQEFSPERFARELDSIEGAVFRCTGITRQLLGFVHPGDVDLQECSLHVLIDDLAVELMGPELAVADIAVTRDYDPDLTVIRTDPNQFRQVVLNLLKNAADSISGPGRITISTRRRGDRFTVTVTDTGHGMTSSEQAKVFMPFFTTKAPGEGTGLGLSVSYGIIKGLGGRLNVTSTPRQGSAFTIDMPLRM